MKKFSQWVTSIADAGKEILSGRQKSEDKAQTLSSLCHELCTSKGEAMGTAIAFSVVKAYQELDEAGRLDFFKMLKEEFSPDSDHIIKCAEALKEKRDRATYKALVGAVKAAPRQTLFHSINMAPGGTAVLVQMREDLLKLLPEHDDLIGIDEDLNSLLVSWFNRGFLTLEQISWETPAHILEKLIAYEAVHEMTGWHDLRRRLAEDRRCFAFFHPALEDEPLIFVQVALVKGIAGNVQELLTDPTEGKSDQRTHKSGITLKGDEDTAIFYSISNCQKGLKGISFGNFLIKQVVLELREELPQLKRFATLSPIPGFRRWLDNGLKLAPEGLLSEQDRQELDLLDNKGWENDPKACEILKPLLTRLCAYYLYHAKRGNRPLDPVARFHLGNGAEIARLNWMGDKSVNGIRQSAGLLVNYAYNLKDVEQNHEAFVNDGEVAIATDVQKLLKRKG